MSLGNGNDAPRRYRTKELIPPMFTTVESSPPEIPGIWPARIVRSKLIPYRRQQELRMKYVTGALEGIRRLKDLLAAASEKVMLVPH